MTKTFPALAAAVALLVPSAADAVTLGREPGRAKREPAQTAVPSTRPSAASPSRYEKIHELFLKGDYAAAEREAGSYLADPRARDGEAVLRIQALCLVKLGRGSQAREKLRRLERSASVDRQAEAMVSTADSYFEEGIYTSAHASYRRVLDKFPRGDEAPYVRRRLAESAQRSAALGRERGARTLKAR